PIGKRRIGRRYGPHPLAENAASTAAAEALRMANQNRAPGKTVSEHDRGDRIGNRVLRSLENRRWNVLEAQPGCELSELDCFSTHASSICNDRVVGLRHPLPLGDLTGEGGEHRSRVYPRSAHYFAQVGNSRLA